MRLPSQQFATVATRIISERACTGISLLKTGCRGVASHALG